MVGWLSGLCLLAAPSCGPDEPPLAPLTSRVTRDSGGALVAFNARPRDLRPAVMRALPSAECAPLTETGTPGEGYLDIELVSILSEPGRVRAEFAPTDGSLAALREHRPITLRVTLGRFGDPDRERKLAERIAREAITLGKREE